MTPRADLHTHTHCSDGRLTPEALVALARERGLRALAVTDHDTVGGVEAAQAAGERLGVEVIAGVELSTTVDREEVHLLGYFFDPAHPALREHLTAFQEARRTRAQAMVERLHDLGVSLRWEAVAARTEGAAIGRPHLAQALVDGGFVDDPGAAFEQYLADGGPACVPKPRFPARDALAMLHAAGGIGVLAHPGHWTSDATVMALIRAGLDGLETIHPSHDAMLTRYYHRIARDFGLIETGGSDYHGIRPSDDARFGQVTVPYAWVDRARPAADAVT
jgi:hypothetical protein